MTLPVVYHELEWYSEVPRSVRWHKTLGLLLLVGALGGFGFWSFTAPLAAALIAQGSFVALGHNQIVQHLEGGIITEIMVSEGERVHAGQPLMRLDVTASYAREQELFLRRARLEGITARLSAMAADMDEMPIPTFLEQHRDNPEVRDIILSQSHAFDVSRRKLALDVQLLQNNVEALRLRSQGYGAQLTAMTATIAIITEDLDGKNTLLSEGLMRRDTINSLRRALVDSEGQSGRLQSQIEETDLVLNKHVDQIEQVRTTYLNEALEELQLMQAELDSVREQHNSALGVTKRSSILAPVDGVVVQLKYNTPGGVIEAGKAIAEILPSDADLMIEAMVSRADIDSLQIGQSAMVRLVALNQRTTPVLEGKVFYVSADAIRDGTVAGGTARDVYLARVSLTKEELDRVPGFVPMPGMPAEVIVTTKNRTFAQYITKPIREFDGTRLPRTMIFTIGIR